MTPGDPERDRASQERAAELDTREAAVGKREAALADRIEAAQHILAEADQRDVDADVRDEGTEKRSRERDWEEFTSQGSAYGSHLPERREAALNRGHAKDDRKASHGDRVALTEDLDESAETD